MEGGEQNSALNVGPATAGTVVPPEPPVEPPDASADVEGSKLSGIEHNLESDSQPARPTDASKLGAEALLNRIYSVWRWPDRRKTSAQQKRDLATARELHGAGCEEEEVARAAYAMTQDAFYKNRAGLSVQRLADDFENLSAKGRRLAEAGDGWISRPAPPISVGCDTGEATGPEDESGHGPENPDRAVGTRGEGQVPNDSVAPSPPPSPTGRGSIDATPSDAPKAPDRAVGPAFSHPERSQGSWPRQRGARFLGGPRNDGWEGRNDGTSGAGVERGDR